MSLNHIFSNPFFRNLNSDPVPSWSYNVVFFVNNQSPEDPRWTSLSDSVISVKVPQRQMGTVTTSFKGLTFDFPTRYENAGTFSIKFTDDYNLSTMKAVFGRMFKLAFNSLNVYDNGTEWSTWIKPHEKDAKVERATDMKSANESSTYWMYDKMFYVRVNVLDPTGASDHPVISYTFYDCYIESISDVDLGYDKDDDVFEYDVSIHYNSMICNANRASDSYTSDDLKKLQEDYKNNQGLYDAESAAAAAEAAAADSAAKKEEDARFEWFDEEGIFYGVSVGNMKVGDTLYYEQREPGIGMSDDVLKISWHKNEQGQEYAVIEGTTTDENGKITHFNKFIERTEEMSEKEFKNNIRMVTAEIYSNDTETKFTEVTGKGAAKAENFNDKYTDKLEALQKQETDPEFKAAQVKKQEEHLKAVSDYKSKELSDTIKESILDDVGATHTEGTLVGIGEMGELEEWEYDLWLKDEHLDAETREFIEGIKKKEAEQKKQVEADIAAIENRSKQEAERKKEIEGMLAELEDLPE